jgi:glutaredoxin
VRSRSESRRRDVEVVVYTRAGCGLCRTAESLVEAEASGASVRLVDVDADEALVRRYGVRVPVVTVDGDEVAELHLAAGTVRRAVRKALRSRRRERFSRARPGP